VNKQHEYKEQKQMDLDKLMFLGAKKDKSWKMGQDLLGQKMKKDRFGISSFSANKHNLFKNGGSKN
jgi:hypothetical protein